MNKYILILIAAIYPAISSCSGITNNQDRVYQYSTIEELVNAKLTGKLTFGELKKRGDHGIGTFNDLDGEMIMLNGIAYRANYDGILEVVEDKTLSPFAVVDKFVPDNKFEIYEVTSCNTLKEKILAELGKRENIYSIEVRGNFSVINARSVKKPEKEGAGLEYVVNNDNKFDLINLYGTAVGFWFPDSLTRANVPGFHFHFVSEDKTRGGHLLDCELEKGTVEIDSNNKIDITLLN